MDWAALIISILALVVAVVVPVLFSWWSKPKMKVLFTHIPYDGLICMIQNRLVDEFQSELGISRHDIRDLHVSFEIYEKATGKRLFFGTEFRDLSFGFGNKLEKHATLPASITKMIFYVAQTKPGADFVDFIRTGPDFIVVPLKDKGDQCELKQFVEGIYRVDLHVYTDGKRKDYIRDFIVSYQHPYVNWVIDDMERYREKLQNAKTKSSQT